jgi:hypothetical protein
MIQHKPLGDCGLGRGRRCEVLAKHNYRCPVVVGRDLMEVP